MRAAAAVNACPDTDMSGRPVHPRIRYVTASSTAAETLALVTREAAGQGPVMVGAEVLTVGLAAWGWIVAIQLPLLRSWQTMRPDLRGPFVLRVAMGQIATIPAIVAGIAVLAGGLGGLYWLVAGTIFSILVALFESWVLLVEINR